MIYYHGTTEANAQKIMREGLKPNPAQAWDVTIDNFLYGPIRLRDVEKRYKPSVYVTKSREHAESFAKLRAAYETAEKGALLPRMPGMPQVKKEASTRVPEAKPAILTIELLHAKLRADVQGMEGNNEFRSFAPIPPEAIKRVEVIASESNQNGGKTI